MSRSSSPEPTSSAALPTLDPDSPAPNALHQLCSLLQSLTAAVSPAPSPSLFDADNLCLYCDAPLTRTSANSAALLLLPSTLELPCGHRLCRPCFSGVSSRRRTCPVPLCNRALPLDLIAAASPLPSQLRLHPPPPPMIRSKSEPSLLSLPAAGQTPAPSGGAASHVLHRIPSCDQLALQGEGNVQGLTLDAVALTLPPHLLDVAAVKTVVNAADVFDVAHDLMPADAQAAALTVAVTAAAADDGSHAAADAASSDNISAAASDNPRPLPPYIITPLAPHVPARVRASRGDVPPVPPPSLRLPFHLQLPPVVHTFTLKTEHPGKPGAAHHVSRVVHDLTAVSR